MAEGLEAEPTLIHAIVHAACSVRAVAVHTCRHGRSCHLSTKVAQPHLTSRSELLCAWFMVCGAWQGGLLSSVPMIITDDPVHQI